MIRALAIALALTPLPALAQTAGDKAAADLALARGKLIYAYDQAAWHGTDAMVLKVAKYEDKIGGWIVDGPANAPTILFFNRDQADRHAIYIADLQGGKIVNERLPAPGSPEYTLSPERKAMIAARQAGIKAWADAKPLYCNEKSPNTVVLPPERAGGPHLVYVMTPQTQSNAWPLGGHFRVEIAADGKTGASRAFTKSCITLEGDASKKEAMLFITHMLDPAPTEIHVFTTLTSQIPLMVGTTGNDMLWQVTGTSITGDKLKK